MCAYYFAAYTLPVYHYESSNREYSDIEVPWKGRHLETVEKFFDEYKNETKNTSVKLCLTSKRVWYAPNLWIDNLTNRRWSLPFMEPSAHPSREYQINKMREEIIKSKTP